MNRINELMQTCIFQGCFRVTSARTLYTRTGKQYMRLQLDDATGYITAYAWEGQYHGPWEIDHLDIININGETRCFNKNWVVDIKSANIFDSDVEAATPLLPASLCAQPNLLQQLEQIESLICNKILKEFIQSIFTDMEIVVPFMQAPASLKYHHCEAGGLMRHSIECAQIVASLPLNKEHHRDLAIIGSLLHDIGKVRVFKNMSRTNLGYLVDHQALTLEVCAKQFTGLERVWPDAALALRHILTCRSIKRWGYEPRMAIAHAIQLADRLSVEMDMEENSFSEVAETRNISSRIANHQTYWRPSYSQ